MTELEELRFALSNTNDPINKIHLEGKIAMYEVYTTIWGIKVPEELNHKLQESELAEAFHCMDSVEGFTAEVPYAGAGMPDIHLGIVLSTDNAACLGEKDVTEAQRELFTKTLADWRALFEREMDDWREEDSLTEEDEKILEEFHAVLDQSPTVYRAYSTS